MTVDSTLIKEFPTAVRSRDSKCDRYPLRVACLHRPRIEVVRLLIENFKEAASYRDSLGRFPLHYADFGKATADIVRCLLQAHPTAVHPMSLEAKTRRGSDPVRVATLLHGGGSSMEAKMQSLKSAVDAVFDTERGQLSLAHVSKTLWPEENTGED
jgi:ankyrin repeat protein